jgi:hypothetical protein
MVGKPISGIRVTSFTLWVGNTSSKKYASKAGALTSRTFTNPSQQEIFQQRVSGVTLEAIEESPILFCIRKGCIHLPPNNVGVVIPLRNPENMFSLEEDNIDVKSGDYHKNAMLVPHTMIVLSGGDSELISFQIPAHVPIYMIIHPKLPLTAPEVLAT